MKNNTINKKEIEKFSKIAEERWDPNGKFKPLHKFNPIRIKYIRNTILSEFKFNKRGGVGIISVTANIAPKLCSDMQKFSKSDSDNEMKNAERIDALLQPVHKALFIESNPSPVKYAAKLLGLCDDAVRLPLVKILDETKLKVKNSLISAKLLND